MVGSDTEIQVKLTAEMAQLQAGMDAGAASVAQATDAMQASFGKAAEAITTSNAVIVESTAAVAKATEKQKTDLALMFDAMSGNTKTVEALAEQQAALARIQAEGSQSAASLADAESMLADASIRLGVVTDLETGAIAVNTEAKIMNARVSGELGTMLGEVLSGNFGRLRRSAGALANQTGLLAKAFTPIGLGVLAASAAVIGFGVELVKGAEYQNEFNKALEQTGGFLNVTEDRFNGMAEAIQSSETTLGTAREAMLKIAESGRFSGQAMQDAGKAAVDFAALTGISIDKAVAEVVKIQEKPVQALEKLNEQYHFLTLAQIEHIQKLQDEGQATEASEEAVKLFEQTNADRLQKADQDVGLLVQAWRGLKGAISAAGQAVQDFGKKQTDQAKFDVLATQLENLNAAKARGVTLDLRNDGKSVSIDAEIDAVRKKMGAMQDARVAQDKLTAAAVAAQKVQDAGIDAKGEIDYLHKLVKGEDAYTEALNKAKAALEATHAANPNDASLKGISFDDKGNANGGEGLDKIEAALHKKFDIKAAHHQSEHKLAEDELKQEEADQQISNANKLQFEIDFWSKRRDAAARGSKAYADAYGQVNRLTKQLDAEKLRAAQKATKDAQEGAKEEATNAISAAQNLLAIQKEKIETSFALGQISKQRELAQLAAANDAEYAAELSAMQRELGVKELELKERQRINLEIQKLQQKHELEMLRISDDAAKANQQMWQKRLAPISQAFNQSINGMIQGTQTLQQSLAKIGDSIVAKFVQMGINMVVNWAANELAKTTATTAGAAQRSIVEAGAAAESKAADAATGKSQITSAAATGAAKAYQAIVGIPFVGPVLAPIAAGVAFAGIEAFSGMISSAQGGWERVPIDGMMTELHKDEMVLPAHVANPIRDMAKNGGGQGGGGQVHIHATDARSFKDMLRRNPGALAGALKQAGRMGHFGGATR